MQHFLISAIGNDLYQKLIDDHEKEQQQKQTEVEKRAWRLATEEKARAVKEARETAEIELEKAMAAAKKAQVSVPWSFYGRNVCWMQWQVYIYSEPILLCLPTFQNYFPFPFNSKSTYTCHYNEI